MEPDISPFSSSPPSFPEESGLPIIQLDPPQPRRSSLVKQLLPFLAVTVVLITGLTSVLWLVQTNQDIRNRAFTGYKAEVGGQTKETSEALRLAKPEDVPTDKAKIEQTTLRGLFYTLAQLYQYAEPEYQPVVVTDLQIAGQVFLKYDPTLGQTFIFSRFVNVPLANKSVIRVWIQSKTNGQYFVGQNVELDREDNDTVMYSVVVAQGDLRTEAQNLVFSFDTAQSSQPANPFLTVKF
jgi:hypothetical protein